MLLLLFLNAFLPFSIAWPYEYYWADHDDALLAFVRGPTKFEEFCNEKGVTNRQNIRLLAQYYGMNIGIFCYMRQNWKCKKVKWSERDECLAHQHYMNIFNEYLFNVYAGRIVEEPMFHRFYMQPYHHYCEKTFLEIFTRLSKIGKHYFGNTSEVGDYDYEKATFELKNGDDLNYYSSNFDLITKRTKETDPFRVQFDKIMQKMVKKSLESVRSNREEYEQLEQKIYEKKLEIAKFENEPKKGEMPTPPPAQLSFGSEDAAKESAYASDFLLFYEMHEAIEEEGFVDFVKGKTNINLAPELRVKQQEDEDEDYHHDEKELDDEYINEYENLLGLLYAMKKKWNCANAKFEHECKELQQYLGIIYEYLFRVSIGITSVRPMFRDRVYYGGMRITSDYSLHDTFQISNLRRVLLLMTKFEIGKYRQETESYLKLINETELNFKITNSEIPEITFEEQLVLMAKEICDRKNGDKNEQHIISDEMEGLIRNAFDQFLKEKYEKRVKGALEAREELDVLQLKIIEKTEDSFTYYRKKEKYNEKYWTWLNSPFVPEMPKHFFERDLRDMRESVWKIGLFDLSENREKAECLKCRVNWEPNYKKTPAEWNIEALKDHLFSPIHANSAYAKKYLELEEEKEKEKEKKFLEKNL